MAEYRGKDVQVLFNSVDISGSGRSISLEASADTHDDTVYGADNRTKIAGLTDGSGSFEGLDSVGDWTAAWDEIVPGAKATMSIYPEGPTPTSNRAITFSAVVTARSLDLPYDDLATFSMSFEIDGAVSYGTVAAP